MPTNPQKRVMLRHKPTWSYCYGSYWLQIIQSVSMMRTMMEVLLTTVMAWPGCLLKTHSVWSTTTKLTGTAAQHRECNSAEEI